MYIIFDTNAAREYVEKIDHDQIDNFTTINAKN